MIPFNPLAPSIIWYQAWRDHIRSAKQFPAQARGYCRAAMIAQCEYLCYITLEIIKEKSK